MVAAVLHLDDSVIEQKETYDELITLLGIVDNSTLTKDNLFKWIRDDTLDYLTCLCTNIHFLSNILDQNNITYISNTVDNILYTKIFYKDIIVCLFRINEELYNKYIENVSIIYKDYEVTVYSNLERLNMDYIPVSEEVLELVFIINGINND